MSRGTRGGVSSAAGPDVDAAATITAEDHVVAGVDRQRRRELIFFEAAEGSPFYDLAVGVELHDEGLEVTPAVADVFDALTSARPYKHAWPADKALKEIQAHGGHQFSPRVVDAFLSLAEEGAVREILASQIATPVVYPSSSKAA